ncbi:MAG: hypothetical protein ACI31F_06270 [Muribaculaceae bacterium]
MKKTPIDINEKLAALDAPGKSPAEKLYIALSSIDFTTQSGYFVYSLNEGMSVIDEAFGEWGKSRYLMDNNNHRAYEIMDKNLVLVNFTTDDINWESLENLPEEIKMRARNLSAEFPTAIRGFSDGIAVVEWELNPDGDYYMDSDGYGMTTDEEITLYSYIDREMNVLVKFEYLDRDWEHLERMRQTAIRRLKNKQLK